VGGRAFASPAREVEGRFPQEIAPAQQFGLPPLRQKLQGYAASHDQRKQLLGNEEYTHEGGAAARSCLRRAAQSQRLLVWVRVIEEEDADAL